MFNEGTENSDSTTDIIAPSPTLRTHP